MNQNYRTSHVRRLYQKSNYFVCLVRLKNKFSEDVWAYVQTSSERSSDLLNSYKNNDEIDVNNYGIILFSGKGIDPPKHVVDKVEQLVI